MSGVEDVLSDIWKKNKMNVLRVALDPRVSSPIMKQAKVLVEKASAEVDRVVDKVGANNALAMIDTASNLLETARAQIREEDLGEVAVIAHEAIDKMQSTLSVLRWKVWWKLYKWYILIGGGGLMAGVVYVVARNRG